MTDLAGEIRAVLLSAIAKTSVCEPPLSDFAPNTPDLPGLQNPEPAVYNYWSSARQKPPERAHVLKVRRCKISPFRKALRTGRPRKADCRPSIKIDGSA